MISIGCRLRTFREQSGALENIGQRETKIAQAAMAAVRSFAPRSPRILGIFDTGISKRELCPRDKWRNTGDSNTRYEIDPVVAASGTSRLFPEEPPSLCGAAPRNLIKAAKKMRRSEQCRSRNSKIFPCTHNLMKALKYEVPAKPLILLEIIFCLFRLSSRTSENSIY